MKITKVSIGGNKKNLSHTVRTEIFLVFFFFLHSIALVLGAAVDRLALFTLAVSVLVVLFCVARRFFLTATADSPLSLPFWKPHHQHKVQRQQRQQRQRERLAMRIKVGFQ